MESQQGNRFGNNTPKKIVRDFLHLAPVGKPVLDLGCGSGNNSVYAALSGYRVIAVDADPAKIALLQDGAHAENVDVQIQAHTKNVLDFTFDTVFSGIICTDVLHFLKHDQLLHMVEVMKAWTCLDGIHIVTVFTKKGDLRSEKMYFFDKGELQSLYADWDILFYDERFKKTLACDKLGNPMNHEVAVLVAKKG